MDPLSGTYLSCALLCRGSVTLGSLQRQVDLLSTHMSFAAVADAVGDPVGGHESSSTGGSWKLGLCSVPAPSAATTVLALSNNTAIVPRLQALHDRCFSLFARRAHWHHYLDCGLEEEQLNDSLYQLRDTMSAYDSFEQQPRPSAAR